MEKRLQILRRYTIAYMPLTIFFLLYSCKKEAGKPDYPAGSNQYINTWVLDSMKVYYYWNTTLPSKINIDGAPADFFSSILNGNDRFSRLTNPSVPQSYYPSLVHTFGFDLAVYQEGSGEIKTVITLVVPGTTAQDDGLQRGSMINSINGQKPSGNTIAGLISTAITQRSIVLELEGGSKITLGAALISENPVYTYKTFHTHGKSVAYLFYNSFEGRSKFDLQKAFSFFQNKGATELIVDLRYNSGGDVGMCAALAAVLSPVSNTDTFVEYRGNNNAGTRKETFEKTVSKIMPGYSFDFAELRAMRLPLQRVFILTGAHTASAAEFLVKGLRPWINVIQIGSSTLGKDMASFVIKDSNVAKANNWSIEPMIFKLYNSKSEGNYPSGLTPDVAVNEFISDLVPFGDENDPLIKTALSVIGPASGMNNTQQRLPARLLYDSRDLVDKFSGQIRISRDK